MAIVASKTRAARYGSLRSLRRPGRLGFGLVMTLLGLHLTASMLHGQATESTDPQVRIYGVRILVSDMDEAIRFYSGILGFGVLSTRDYPDQVELKSVELRLLLVKTERPAQYDYVGTVRTTFGFQANDLLATRARLIKEGVVFVEKEPEKVGIGIATTFKDPFGNVLYLLEQQVGEEDRVDEPRIYNVGFHVPDAAVAEKLYCDVLGFVVRTDRYFPAVPLGHKDGTFAFMLHQKPGLAQRTSRYPDEAQIIPLFKTTNFDVMLRALAGAGTKYHQFTRPGVRGITIYDMFGDVSEVVETTADDS